MKDSLFLMRENNKTTILGNVAENPELFLENSGIFPLILLESVKLITSDNYSDETQDQENLCGIQIDYETSDDEKTISIGIATNLEKEDAILILVDSVTDFLYGDKTLIQFPI